MSGWGWLGLLVAVICGVSYCAYWQSAREDEKRLAYRAMAAPITEARKKAHQADSCVPAHHFVTSADAGWQKLREDVAQCKAIAATISAEIDSCAKSMPNERCAALVQAWHCLHNLDCYGDSERAMDEIVEAVREDM